MACDVTNGGNKGVMNALVFFAYLFVSSSSSGASCQVAVLPANKSVDRYYKANIEIVIQREKLAKVGVEVNEFLKVVDEFFDKHSAFKLSDLHALKVAEV